MLEQINMLREKLEIQILENKSYDEILTTSKEIDRLLVEYYNSISFADTIVWFNFDQIE